MNRRHFLQFSGLALLGAGALGGWTLTQQTRQPLLLRDPEQLPGTRCLQLGLGAAAITKYCHSVLRLPTTAVEINPQVIGVCRSWFHLPEDDERLTVVQADAARYVASDDQVARFDALSVDLYDHEAASPVLDDEAFYRACWRCSSWLLSCCSCSRHCCSCCNSTLCCAC